MKWAIRLLAVMATIFIGLVFLAFTFLKIEKVSWEDVTEVVGRISYVELSKSQDVFIGIEGQDLKYYINRGMEKDVDLDRLEVGSDVSIHFVQVLPFEWNQMPLHVARIEVGDVVVYNEIHD
jgi:hypothetical protein